MRYFFDKKTSYPKKVKGKDMVIPKHWVEITKKEYNQHRMETVLKTMKFSK